jgi:peptidoglycan LD-endopeptidase CwlK
VRRLEQSEVTPELTTAARWVLRKFVFDSAAFGAEIDTGIVLPSGEAVIARLERHYHPPGGSMKPWGYHRGVSLFARPALLAEAPIPGGFQLGARSRSNLKGVHPDLVLVVETAIDITDIDFAVIEGVRTIERQRELVAKGASRTLDSRHLTGHAVDCAPWVGGKISWEWPHYHQLAAAIKRAADSVHVNVEWGGDWAAFKDGPHWQLPRSKYP